MELEHRIIHSHPKYEYVKDGRAPVRELLPRYKELWRKNDWSFDVIYTPSSAPPVYGFVSPHKPDADKFLWIIGGIHGEEPAGPNAFAREIETIAKLPEMNIPVVFIPLVNTAGYIQDRYYPNVAGIKRKGKSVGDSDHFLIDEKTHRPRLSKPVSEWALSFTRWVVTKSFIYPPFLVVDHHETRLGNNIEVETYGFIQGETALADTFAVKITNTLLRNNFSICLEGETPDSKHERITNGHVYNTKDGSIDELLATPRIWLQGGIVEKPSAKIAITIETLRSKTKTLPKRIDLHSEIIRMYPEFWEMMGK
jgi:hypothetical protein